MRIEPRHSPLCGQGDITCLKCMVNRYGVKRESSYLEIAEVVDETFVNYTSFGSYTVLFSTDDSCVLCADCAKRALLLDHTPVTCDVYDEGPSCVCKDCGREIEASYGDPWMRETIEKHLRETVWDNVLTLVLDYGIRHASLILGEKLRYTWADGYYLYPEYIEETLGDIGYHRIIAELED